MKSSAERSPLAGTIGTIALSLVLGFAVWATVKMKDTLTLRMTVPVVPRGVPDYVELELDPPNVMVLLTYPKADESFLSPENFQVVLDLSHVAAKAGLENFTSDSERISIEDVHPLKRVPPTVIPDRKSTRLNSSHRL